MRSDLQLCRRWMPCFTPYLSSNAPSEQSTDIGRKYHYLNILQQILEHPRKLPAVENFYGIRKYRINRLLYATYVLQAGGLQLTLVGGFYNRETI